MWLFGAPAKRGHAYSMTGLMREVKNVRIDSSGRIFLHLRITPNFLEQENQILLRCSVHERSKEKLTPSRSSI